MSNRVRFSNKLRWSTRASRLCEILGVKIPIFLAPMAGACPVDLSVAVARSGGLGACGVLLMQPDAILKWASDFRAQSNGMFQLNNWIPDPPPRRNKANEKQLREFIASWLPEDTPAIPDTEPPDFESQCEAMLAARPRVISSIMGIYPEDFVSRMKSAGIFWMATATTVAEAEQAHAAGADAIIAQGFEAGGHRGTFYAEAAQESAAGLLALIPAIADQVNLPVIAAGGIADHRGVAAALALGASAVQIGTGFLRTYEADIPSEWADAIELAAPHNTLLTRAFSGRLGRTLANEYALEASAKYAPDPAPYPVQRQLTSQLTASARRNNDFSTMQAWAGQASRLAKRLPADQLAESLWYDAKRMLR